MNFLKIIGAIWEKVKPYWIQK